MKGAILEKGETGYTYLKKLFLSIRHAQKDFNWLITDCQCCTQSEAFYQRIFQYNRYGWLSGEELTRMVETVDLGCSLRLPPAYLPGPGTGIRPALC